MLGTLESICHSSFLIFGNQIDRLGLLPGINKDKCVVCCDTKDDENGELVHICIVVDVENHCVDELSQWEREDDHRYTGKSQEQTVEMNPDVDEYKQ